MAFPKIKEFTFRVNRASPLEIAAKALAKKNGNNWCDYSFSHIEKDRETRYHDLETRFEAPAKDTAELILFYRVNNL